MGTGMPAFSVVIGTYNRAGMLPESVRSVLDQTFGDFEVVVVDDGSTDNTRDVVRTWTDPRLRYVYRHNGGYSAAHNTGVANAKGEFVTFLDDDDAALPCWLEKLHRVVQTTDCAVVSCGATYAYEQGQVSHTALPVPLGPVFENQRGLFLAGTFAVRRDVYDAAGGFADGLECAQNTEFSLRLVALCTANRWQIRTIDEPLVLIRRRRLEHREGSSPQRIVNGTKYILDRHGERLAQSPKTLAEYRALAGVAAARTGDYREARSLLWGAVRTYPRQWRHLLRFIVSLARPLGNTVWRVRRYRGPGRATAKARRHEPE
jgi:glycosyltransferase involved in cell wall biosynthesis